MITIIWYLYFWFTLVFLLPTMFKAEKLTKQGKIKEADEITQKWVPWWANSLVKLAGNTITVNGKENIPTDEAVVFVGNHRSMYDVPVLLTQLGPCPCIVAKIETLKIPLIRNWMKLLHCVFLDRDNPRKAVASMNEAGKNLKDGYNVAIFPEGTRSKGEQSDLLEFKAGAFRIATKAKAKIVPIAIHNTRDALEKNHYWMKATHIVVDVLPCIDTANMSKEEQAELPEKVKKIISDALK